MHEPGCIICVLVCDVFFPGDQKHWSGLFFVRYTAFAARFGTPGSRETAEPIHSNPQMFTGCLLNTRQGRCLKILYKGEIDRVPDF